MKHMYKILAALTAITAIWLLPQEMVQEVRVAEKFQAFEVTIEGAVLFPKTLRFYEPVSFSEILMFVGGYDNVEDNYRPSSLLLNQTTTIKVPFKRVEAITIQNQLINVNKASFSELLKIPSMTETRAAELIIYRQQNGPFTSIEELIHVKYIGTVTLENMRPYISLS